MLTEVARNGGRQRTNVNQRSWSLSAVVSSREATLTNHLQTVRQINRRSVGSRDGGIAGGLAVQTHAKTNAE